MECSLPGLLFATRHSPFADVTLGSMRLCRFNNDRLGLVRDDGVYDITAALDALPAHRYPLPRHDPLIAQLAELRTGFMAAAECAKPIPLKSVALLSPIANPGKIVAAPVNYKKHLEEARADRSEE